MIGNLGTSIDRDSTGTLIGETPWTSEDLAAIRQGKSGRKVIAYISIGEAEDYRPYWRKEWGSKGKLTAAAPSERPPWRNLIDLTCRYEK